MKYYLLVLTFILFGCFTHNEIHYNGSYNKNIAYGKITIKSSYDNKHGIFEFSNTDTLRELFNSNKQLIADDSYYYKYDSSGNLFSKTCFLERKGNYFILTDYYYYDNLKRLVKIISLDNNNRQSGIEYFDYYDSGLLKSVVQCDNTFEKDSIRLKDLYSYDNDSNVISHIQARYRNGKFDTENDSFYYNSDKKLIRQKHYDYNSEYYILSNYIYEKGKLSIKTDTTINGLPFSNARTSPENIYSPYYGKTEYRYNSNQKVVEEFHYRSDYKTVDHIFKYEYLNIYFNIWHQYKNYNMILE